MKRMTVNPDSLFNSRQFGFSQVVVAEPGKIVFISGQVAWDKELNLAGENDLAKQIQKSLENLGVAIRAAGGDYENIAMLRIYKVDYKDDDSQVISEALIKFFGTDNPPASTFLGVDRLANSGFMIEIEAQAVI